jgi:hypothetical protein
LGKCLPLAISFEDCRGAAASPGSSEPRLVSSADNDRILCGSCFRNESLKLIINNKCQSVNDTGCGEDQTLCRPHQRCQKGKCKCQFSLGQAFSWEPAIDADPDNDNKFDITSRPASGCDPVLLSSNSLGAFDRSFQTLFRFVDCAIKSRPHTHNFTQMTPLDFRNQTFRALACPGGQGRCPTLFCDELERNFTGDNRNQFCGTAADAFSRGKSCSQNWKISGEREGDLLCANEYALFVLAVDINVFGIVDMFNFMGCDQPRDDMIVFLDGTHPALYQYEVETARKYLGSASTASVSVLVLFVVGFISMIITFY